MDTKKTYNNKGADYLSIIPEKLGVEEISNLVKSPSCGAISMFIGTTRDNFDGLKVVSLEYEAYQTMALKVLKDICNNLRETWPDIVNIAIYHRLGNVATCEASVIIAISSPHRQSSLSAVDAAINKLKVSVPIWKKEQYAEGQNADSKWKENPESLPPREQDVDSMIQINSSHDEVFSNIESFRAYRKSLNSKDNIRTFCQRSVTEKSPYSCIRVDATGHRVIATQSEQQYRKEHFEDTGSNERNSDTSKTKSKKLSKEASSRHFLQAPDQLSSHQASVHLLEQSSISKSLPLDQQSHIPFGIRERLLTVELHLGVTPQPGDVYARMKQIEDRIMEIEDDCEAYLKQKNYFNKGGEPSCISQYPEVTLQEHDPECVKTKVFSIEDIDDKIRLLKSQLSSLAGDDSSDMSGDET
uniref:Molybdopterin synthase catalytic subunit n=2 Tax=Cacopsylla melanoneura TaxID=428564 RepID=A0A8D8TXZ5_9HEMI